MLCYHHDCPVMNKCNRNGLAKQDREKPMRPQKSINDLGKLEMGEVAYLERSNTIGCPVPSGHAEYIHIKVIIQTEKLIFMNICISIYAYNNN